MFMTERLKIVTLDNGPYLAKGSLKLLDAEGDEFRAKRATVALCRCGGSTNKPFCDGTHSKAGFRVAERAVRQVEGRV
jgi:CDGSH-type Zn-finger protein